METEKKVQSWAPNLPKMGSGSNTFTVDEALISQGFGYFQFLVLAYAGMGWISEAAEMMLLSFVGPSVQVQWNLSSHEESLITSVVFVGMLFGVYSWGIVSDNYGRRVGFLFTAIVTSGAGLLSSFAPNYISLLILRFVVGVGLGGGPVLASWFLEFVPAPNRGTWMVIFQAFWTIGTILEASLAWAVMPKLGWRWLLAFSSIPSFLLLLFYHMVPESPRYLCMKGRISEAMHIFEKMARTNRAALPPGVLISDKRTELDENSHPTESSHLITAQDKKTVVVDEVEPKTFDITSFTKLLSPELIKSTLLLWMTFFGNAFSYYGIVLLTSELSGGNSKCTAEPLLEHSVGSSLYKNVFISSFAEVPGLLLSATIVDRFGRKLSMSALLFISCAFLLPLVVEQNEAITTALLFGARVCISGSFAIIYVYAPEIYPTSLRTTGVGTASSVGRIGGMLCPLVAVALVHGCHQMIALLLFELVLFLSGMAVIFFPLETSGKGLADSVRSMK
ncbi:organic cation/carnitine transporter 7-like isoform X3 [Phalaenopsis equestris]|uniref:organic cation/carnitine transporter 7-like isoform X3 n=1 Tax=Phalaenopsis equestris TaxID=78828 RepID=UPI0009E472DC|nr:organic cation/carnitine transporter 7-like isoform X3 [Phalaenopsis equestris]